VLQECAEQSVKIRDNLCNTAIDNCDRVINAQYEIFKGRATSREKRSATKSKKNIFPVYKGPDALVIAAAAAHNEQYVRLEIKLLSTRL